MQKIISNKTAIGFDADTEILTSEGFFPYSMVVPGDKIYSWENGCIVEGNIKNVISNRYTGILHEYQSDAHTQVVTPNHSVLNVCPRRKRVTTTESSELFGAVARARIPTRFNKGVNCDEIISDSWVVLAAVLYMIGEYQYKNGDVVQIKTGANYRPRAIDDVGVAADELGFPCFIERDSKGVAYRHVFKGDIIKKIVEIVPDLNKIDALFTKLPAHQSRLFINTCAKYDGKHIQRSVVCKNQDFINTLQHIAVRAGYTSFQDRSDGKLKLRINSSYNTTVFEKTEVNYSGIVWCPESDRANAVFRRNGYVFISGTYCADPN